MRFISTQSNTPSVSFREALEQGLAPDGGLFVPERMPVVTEATMREWRGRSLADVADDVLWPYVEGELERDELRALLKDALNFETPITTLHDSIFLLELTHGPTLAFKDVAARVMARLTAALLPPERKITVLVATSGDTGGAVAHAYHNLPNLQVRLLYPKGKVSPLQQKQLTTLGGNVTAFEVEGTFDDCQRMVKAAFQDVNLVASLGLTSANSINVARLLPQMSYHAWAWANFPQMDTSFDLAPLVAVPSGNFGNLTAGLFAKRMGVPVPLMVAANNRNDPVRAYLETGHYQERDSIHTLSNAMDIGAPSNLARLQWLYGGSVEALRQDLSAFTATDEETLDQMKATTAACGRVIDPHTAVGVHAVRQYREKTGDRRPALVFATADAAKFPEVVERALGLTPAVPSALEALQEKTGSAISLAPRAEDLKVQLKALA